MLRSLCEGMDLFAMRNATVEKVALAELIDSQMNGKHANTTKDQVNQEHAHLHATPASSVRAWISLR